MLVYLEILTEIRWSELKSYDHRMMCIAAKDDG